MALVNIGAGNADDDFYRYKMPKLVAKIEGRGNGIKTNIVNMVDVAKALSRPPSYTTKYFGCVLGAQSKFDEKTGTSTVNGAHDTGKLVQHLEGFIKTYVQCYGCGNPETEVVITKSQCINLKCAACGFVSDVDMRDKLTTFILKNPPEVKKKKGDKNMRRAEKERLKAGEALDEEAKKGTKDASKKKGSTDGKKKKKAAADESVEKGGDESPGSSHRGDAEDEEEDDVEWQTDTSAEAAQQRIQEQLTAAAASMVMAAAEEKAISESPRANGSAANGTATNGVTKTNGKEPEEEDEEDEDEVAEESEHDALVAELKDYIQTHKLAEVADYVSKKDLNADLFIALVEALLGGVSKSFAKEIVKKKAVLSAVASDEATQKNLLLGVEHFFAIKAGAAAKEVALVLKALYDEEIVEEEVIFDWESSKELCPGLDAKQAAGVRKLSAPFVDWLKEADEDEDDE